MASYVDYCDTLISWTSILKDFRDMLLNTCQYHLIFLMEEHVVIAPASIARNLLLKICSPDDIQGVS